MSNKNNFDSWFNGLTAREQSEIIEHIVSTKLEVTNEGFFSGPSGQTLTKGLFSGPSGSSNQNTCHACGRAL